MLRIHSNSWNNYSLAQRLTESMPSVDVFMNNKNKSMKEKEWTVSLSNNSNNILPKLQSPFMSIRFIPACAGIYVMSTHVQQDLLGLDTVLHMGNIS